MLFSEVSVEGTTDKSGPAQDLNCRITPDVYSLMMMIIIRYIFTGEKAMQELNMPILLSPGSMMQLMPHRPNGMLFLAQLIFTRACVTTGLTNQFGDVPAVMSEVTDPKLDFYSTKREVILQTNERRS